MANIRSCKELRVWQNAMDAAMLIFKLSKRFPPEEKYSLTDQFRRASRSVAANIAEAWRKRRYPAAFISKLNDAEGEASEVQTWIEFALRCKYIKPDEASDLDYRYEMILGQLVTMIEKPGNWVVGAHQSPPVPASPSLRVPSSPSLRVPSSPGPRVPGPPGPRVSTSPEPRVTKEKRDG